MASDLEEAAKNLNQIAKKYNPINNEIKFKDGAFSWKLDPKIKFSDKPFEDIDQTKIDVKLKKDLSENFEMTVNVKGNFKMEDLNAKLEFKLRY
jgi:hypothetical protein